LPKLQVDGLGMSVHFFLPIFHHLLSKGYSQCSNESTGTFINFWPFIATGLSYLVLHNRNKNHRFFIDFSQNLVMALFIMTVLLFEH